jgi:K+-transporting ATPase ATPase A chain
MLIGRFLIIIPMLAIAGSLAMKKAVAVTSGTLPTHGPLFVGLLVGTVIIVGALTYLPALSLTPIAEHLLMMRGRDGIPEAKTNDSSGRTSPDFSKTGPGPSVVRS